MWEVSISHKVIFFSLYRLDFVLLFSLCFFQNHVSHRIQLIQFSIYLSYYFFLTKIHYLIELHNKQMTKTELSKRTFIQVNESSVDFFLPSCPSTIQVSFLQKYFIALLTPKVRSNYVSAPTWHWYVFFVFYLYALFIETRYC